MANKNVNIKFTAESKDAEKGINKVTAELNKLSKNKALSSMAKLGSAVTGAGVAFKAATAVIGKVGDAIADLSAAYNVQATAEKQLEAAAKNNPYLSDYSVQQLKDYAGELQSISTVGDEQLLPMMAQLASAGRTQNEIQAVMKTALNMSATGAMSLEAAVKQLNATYSGSAGKLGQFSAAVQGLTADQLKNGDAVRILGEQYEGIAKEVSDATGGWQKFKNSFGDMKEALGKGAAEIQNKAGHILSSVFDTITGKIKDMTGATKEAEAALKKMAAGGEQAKNPTADQLRAQIQLATTEIKNAEEELDKLHRKYDEMLKGEDVGNSEIEKRQEELEKGQERYVKLLEKASELREKGNSKKASGYESQANAQKVINDRLEASIKLMQDQQVQNTINLDATKKANEAAHEQIAAQEAIVKANQDKIATLKDQLKKEEELEAKRANEVAHQKSVSEYVKANRDALAAQVAEIERKYALQEQEGKLTDEMARKEAEVAKEREIQAAKESSYLDLISKDRTLITERSKAAKDALSGVANGYGKLIEKEKELAEFKGDKQKLEEMRKEAEKLTEEARKFVSEFDDTKLSARIGKSILALMDYRDTLKEGTEAWEEYNDKIRELSALLDEVEAKEAADDMGQAENQTWAEKYSQKLAIVEDFASKYNEIMQGLSDLAVETAENEATAKTAALEKQFADGLISEDEYNEKKEQIEKEAAEKTYKAQMWAWSANLLEIQANTALAIMQALAKSGNPYVGVAMAATMGVLGAVQLATAIKNKPIPPSYATGGVVGGFGGASMGGDNTYIHARNGEMILNAQQQRSMFDMLNGGSRGGNNVSVSVKNYAAGNASVSMQPTQSGIEMIIRETVRAQMRNGDYDSSLLYAEQNMDGMRYVN